MTEKLKTHLVRFRSGNCFFIALLAFLVGWFALRSFAVIHDPDNGWLNLLLSLEASVMTSMLLDLSIKDNAATRVVLHEIEEEIEEVLEHPHG